MAGSGGRRTSCEILGEDEDALAEGSVELSPLPSLALDTLSFLKHMLGVDAVAHVVSASSCLRYGAIGRAKCPNDSFFVFRIEKKQRVGGIVVRIVVKV